MCKRFLSILIIIIATVLSAQADATFTVNSPGNVIQGRKFALTFRLKDGQGNNPKAPNLQGCTLVYGPSISTMSSTQIINGSVTSSFNTDYTFTYSADTPGKVTVPEVEISCDGKILKSRSITFEILPADQAPSKGGAGGSGVRVDDISTQTPGQVSKDDFFVRIELSRSQAYEQEPILCTIYVYTKFSISSFLIKTQPTFDGFLSQELETARDFETVHYNGQNYYRAMLKRVLLYPQKAGNLTISSGLYDVTIRQYQRVSMGFFTTTQPVDKQITTASNSASVKVNPLPEPQPAGFNGAVGRFSANVELNPEHLLTNEAATYSYIVKGSGNIQYLSQPAINFPPGFDEYTPKVDVDTRYSDGNTTGTYRVDYTIVPQEQGKYTLTAPDFVYFDPSAKEYKTIEMKEIQVNVGRGAAASVAAVEQNQIDKRMQDILYIKTNHVPQTHDVDRIFSEFWFWALWILLAVLLVAAIAINHKQAKLNADIAGRKLSRANKVAQKRLNEANKFMKAGKNDEFYQALAKALWGYLSDKLGIPASQLMRENIQSTLEERGVSEDKTQAVLHILDECEMARFTPHTEAQVSEMYQMASDAIRSLENTKVTKTKA